jgi:chloramphenicol O-acetyltransferase type A
MNGEGTFKIIDQADWPRREQFELFKTFGSPYFSITADVDITTYRQALPKGGRFTIGLVHAIASAANAVPQFRQRIRGNDVIEFATVHPSIIVLNEEEAFRFCAFPYSEDYAAFAKDVPSLMERAKAAASMFDFADQDDFLFLTGLPWISFTGVMHAAPTQAPDSVPRIAWGKYRRIEDRIMMPLNVQVHHALVDGIHVGRFYAQVEEILGRAAEWLPASD